MRSEEMKVTYIDPGRRALYVAELPDGGYGAWAQKDKEAPRRLISKGYIKPEGYGTFGEAQEALALYVSNKRNESGWARWDVLVNGKTVEWDELHAMTHGELAAPSPLPPAAAVTLANIEYRIATHIQGAYENILEVGRCLNEAKDAGLVPHGQWEAWVRTNTGMSERNAQKLMQAARCVHSGSMMNKLPISKIQAILALPEAEREPMAEKAASEDMSLRELQEAVKAQKKAEETAQAYKEAQQKSEARAAEAERELQRLRHAEALARTTQNKLLDQLEKAREAAKTAPAGGISPEAQAEIDRLRQELDEAESYAERQAELRQQAQRELLNQRAQDVRGDATGSGGLTVGELAAAVRAFIGAAGVLPHMGMEMVRMPESDRQQIRHYVDMVDAWVEGARRSLNTTVYIEQEG